MSGFRVFLVVLAFCVVAGVGGGYALWRAFGPAAVEELQGIQSDATEFAAENDQSACAPEAFRRTRTCDGVWCEMKQPAFMQECLSRAAPADDLCDEIPDSVVRAALWTQTACADVDDIRPEICSRILREVLQACLARGL